MHQVGFLVADHPNSVFEPRFVEIFDQLGLLVTAHGKKQGPVLAKVGDAADFGIALDKTFQAKARLAVVVEIQGRGQFIEFLGPLQRPATVVVLEYPLAAEIQAGDREPAEQGGRQNLDGQDLVHEHALAAFPARSKAGQPAVNRA